MRRLLVDLVLAQDAVKERSVRYEWNHERAVSWIPYQEESLSRRMEWSMVSNAAERSRRQRQVTCLLQMARMMESWMERRTDSVEWNMV